MTMDSTDYSEKDALKAQIRQVREFLAIKDPENMMSNHDLWMRLKNNTSGKIHPRLRKMLDQHLDPDGIETGLARLERDLKDMDRTKRQLQQAPDKIVTGDGNTTREIAEEPDSADTLVDDSQKSLYEYTE